jgi:DUF2934 family protein
MDHFPGRAHRRDRRDSREVRINTPPPEPTHDEIARLAYSYWESGGRREGSSMGDWLRAERELRERAASQIYW